MAMAKLMKKNNLVILFQTGKELKNNNTSQFAIWIPISYSLSRGNLRIFGSSDTTVWPTARKWQVK